MQNFVHVDIESYNERLRMFKPLIAKKKGQSDAFVSYTKHVKYIRDLKFISVIAD